MAEILKFWFKLRPPLERGRRTRRRSAEFIPFPYSRRRGLVEQHGRAMRAMPDDEAEAYLTQVLRKMCSDLTAIGIDCIDCQHKAIYDFAEAIGRELHGSNFSLELDEVAN